MADQLWYVASPATQASASGATAGVALVETPYPDINAACRAADEIATSGNAAIVYDSTRRLVYVGKSA